MTNSSIRSVANWSIYSVAIDQLVMAKLQIFSRTQNDCDFIARLDGAPCPAGPGQDTRTVCFDAPMHNVAVLIFHVQVNLRVGIGPHKLRYGSFNGDSRLLVVC